MLLILMISSMIAGQVVESTGLVMSPYLEYPQLLGVLLRMLNEGEGSQHVRREVLKVRSQPLASLLISIRGCLHDGTCELYDLLVTPHAPLSYVNATNVMNLSFKEALTAFLVLGGDSVSKSAFGLKLQANKV